MFNWLINKLDSKLKKLNDSRAKTGHFNASRSYYGAKTGDLVADWLTGSTSSDTEIAAAAQKLKDRVRDQERNNPYAANYIQLNSVKVVGATGIKLQMKISFNSKPDEFANNLIEKAFKRWGKFGNPTVDGRSSFVSLQELVEKAVKRDGEVFAYLHSNKKKVQVLESDYVDITYNAIAANGNQIIMGIEYDLFKKAVAYYVFSGHPGDLYRPGIVGTKYIRVPASQILHVYVQLRPGQSRGVPPMAPGMYSLFMMGKYDEAEVVAARQAANKSVFVKNVDDNVQYDEEKEDGSRISDSAPGEWVYGYPGQEAMVIDPKHPNQSHAEFTKTGVRRFGASVQMPYESLGNDREAVNFSSIRSGQVDAIDNYKVDQRVLTEQFIVPLFEWWLRLSLLDVLSVLNFSRFEEYADAASWLPRGYDWVDPKKDAEADILLINNNLTTKQAVVSKRTGMDYVDIVAQRKKEKELEKQELGGTENAGNTDNRQEQNNQPNAQ